MRKEVRGGGSWIGGAIGYRSDQLFEEVAYIAYHFHWSYDQIIHLDHLERLRWVEEIAKINKRINAGVSEEESEPWR